MGLPESRRRPATWAGGAPLGSVRWHCQGRAEKQSGFLLCVCVCVCRTSPDPEAAPTFAEFSKRLRGLLRVLNPTPPPPIHTQPCREVSGLEEQGQKLCSFLLWPSCRPQESLFPCLLSSRLTAFPETSKGDPESLATDKAWSSCPVCRH